MFLQAAFTHTHAFAYSALNTASVLAAQIKSFLCKPEMACVHHVTVSLPDRKRKSTDKYVFEYRSELKSSDDSYAGCKKFPEGLLPIDLNKGPYSKEEMLMFYAWPENQVRSKNGPCLVQG